MPFLIVPLLILLAVIVLVPLGLVRRYQVGTSRQRARGWLVAVNVGGFAISTLLFITAAAITSLWIPDALRYSAAGAAVGGVLGVVGLWLTRWEPGADALHYTPNRWLVLGLTLVVIARILYGLWRAVASSRAGLSGESWFVAAGVAGAMAAGAVVLGYYLVFWLGVRRQVKQHAARRLRRM
jgi:hypothetical protein